MKIENIIFQFHPSCQFDKLLISDLQKQYLADLRSKNSIQDLVTRYLQMGWLVNFQELYSLVSALAEHSWISNQEVVNYFKNLKIKNDSKLQNYKDPKKTEVTYDVQQLLHLPFFRSLPVELAKFLLLAAKVYRFSAQTLICKTDDESRELFVLLKGQAAVYKQNEKYKQFISIVSESSVFGESGFLLGHKRTADVITQETSDILVIPYQADVLDKYLNKEIAQSVLQRFWVQHALLNSEFFKNFPSDCLDSLTFSGKIRNIDSQQILFQKGEASHSAFIVIQGSLVVQQNTVTINTLAQGAFVGEISLMATNGIRTATVIAQKNTTLLEIDRDSFYSLLSQNLYLAKEFQILANQRLQNDVKRASTLSPIRK